MHHQQQYQHQSPTSPDSFYRGGGGGDGDRGVRSPGTWGTPTSSHPSRDVGRSASGHYSGNPSQFASPQYSQNPKTFYVSPSHGGGGSHHQQQQQYQQYPTQTQRLEQTYVRHQPAHSPTSPTGNVQHHQQQQQQQPINQSSISGSLDQDMIDHAARMMDRLMSRDLQFPSLYKSLTQVSDPNSVTGSRPVSGFMDYDYPPFVQRHIVTEKQYSVTHSTPIPTDLNDLLNQADVQYCHMGLFPEIYRAWMTIDSDIYLWDFRDGSDLSFFDGLREPIITMSLVPVKPKIFQDTIKHLLCVITASEVVILGFVLSDAVEPSNTPVIELVPQPIFVVPTEGMTFSVIYGTKKGRIFLGAKDGSIHEVNYQSEKGWMTDRCWKTNLTSSYLSSIFKFMSTSSYSDPIQQIVSDDSRNLLFTRSKSGCLQVFELGYDGMSFTRTGYMSFEGVVNEVVNLSKKTLESNIVKNILTITAITFGEMNLIAVLDNGTRLYFSCYNPPNASIQTPTHFRVVHVRMPPGYCTATVMPKPSTAHTAFATQGLLTLSSRSAQESDSFWMICPFMYPTNCFSEVFSIQKLNGQTLDVKLIPPTTDVSESISKLDILPDVVTQHLNWHREVVVLTSNGTTVLRIHKPYEMLKQLLIECGHTDNFRCHFDSGVSKEQPLANAALLAVHPATRSEPSVLEMTMKAFFLYGTENRMMGGDGRINSPFDNTMDFNPNIVSTPRQDIPGMGQGQSPYNMAHGGGGSESGYMSPPLAAGGQQQHNIGLQSPYSSPSSGEQPIFSARHDAIYLVVGRILFHFWNRNLVKTGTVDTPMAVPIITPNIQSHEVTQAITFLQNIITFINNNPSLYMSRVNLSSTMLNTNTVEGRQLYSQEMEKNSIIALRGFLSLTLEVLNMWKILCDHQFHIVLHGMDNQLQNATMRELVITGHATVSVIINALISKYLGDNAAVDAISMRLREVCPTLFKSEDAIGSKVAEILAKVKNTTDKQEKDLLLKESLVLSEKICGHGRVNIRNLCKQYSDLGFPVGAVRLCVSAAKSADPDKNALDTIRTNTTSSDPIGMQAFQARADIYRIVFDLLDNYVQLSSTNQSPLLRNNNSTEERITPQTAQLCAEETIHTILSSDDEMFHISLYNWLLDKKQFDRLLEIKHPYLDSFLKRAADAVVSGKWPGGGISANDTRVLDLLWRHHEMNLNHGAAAQILSKLAESTTTGLSLQQRLEYMSRAIICSKSCSRRGDLLETLEEKVDVAQIQRNILDAVNSRITKILRASDGEDDSELKLLQDSSNKLNSQLLSITQLYSEFAYPLKLNDAKLEIFCAAGHGDKQIIEAVWSEIIEEVLLSSSSCSSESQMEIIRRKIVTLGKKYRTSPTFFPVDFLIEHLEAMKPTDSENVTWVFKTMLEVGVNFSELLVIYESAWRKYQSRSSGETGGSEYQTAKVIMTMIDSLAKEELDIRTTFLNQPDLLEKCKNLVSAMIVEFSSRFDSPSSGMTLMLKRVRDNLERVVT